MSIFSFKKKGPKGKERRKFIRLAAHHLIKYKVIEQKEELSFARNISAGGVLFVAKESIPPGNIVKILISFPKYPHPIKVAAKVIWTKELKNLGGFKIGAEFVNVEEDARDFINKKILAVNKGTKNKGAEKEES